MEHSKRRRDDALARQTYTSGRPREHKAQSPSLSSDMMLPPTMMRNDRDAGRSRPPSSVRGHDDGEQDELRRADSKVKRAKSAQKITRNRKITSCWQCREKKQKCDRARPMCSNCLDGNSRGGMCTYVDTPEAVQEVLASEGEKDSKRVRRSPHSSDEAHSPPRRARASSSATMPSSSVHQPRPPSQNASNPSTSTTASLPRSMGLPVRSPLAVRRLNLIAATQRAGRDRSLDFEVRVRYARAAAVGAVLFGTPPMSGDGLTATAPMDGYQPLAAVDSLKLPTAAEIGPLLDTYRENIEWMCNVVLVDLNRSRFENFLNWWHSNPQTLPADPPLIPLVLTVLALAIQARRMRPYCTLVTQRSSNSKRRLRDTASSPNSSDGRPLSPRDAYVMTCSSEKELLETAQRCIDILQILCPSNWASAYSAPLDLVRASLLRGLWHMTELHLQFAGSCFATATRLAHAASLNHDTRRWPSMGEEESQARRNIFWSVAALENTFSMRVIQPSIILPHSYDTSFPDNYPALLSLYRFGGLIEPHIVDGRRSHLRVTPVSRLNFNFHLARFKLIGLLIEGQEKFRTGNKGPLAEAHEQWLQELPKELQRALQEAGDEDNGWLGGLTASIADGEEQQEDGETKALQASLLQMMNLNALIQIHRPQADKTGLWRAPDGQAQRSLEICIDSAQRLIRVVYAAVTRDPGPPYVLYHQCVFYCFQAAIVIAIQNALSPSSASTRGMAVQARPSLDRALETLDMIARQDGLRFVAEQAGRYAATLREVDATQRVARQPSSMNGNSISREESQSDSRAPPSDNEATPAAARRRAWAVPDPTDTEVLEHSPAYNVHRSGIGAHALAVAEGEGKIFGGQGYPVRSDAHGQQYQKGRILSGPPSGASTPRGSSWAKAQARGGVVPPSQSFPELLAFQSFSPALHNSGNMTAASFGIDFSDLNLFGADAQTRFDDLMAEDVFGDRTMASTAFLNANGDRSANSGGAAMLPELNIDNAAPAAVQGLDLLADAVVPDHVPLPAPPQQQHALDPLGNTFALDWSEWEHEVERLLYSER